MGVEFCIWLWRMYRFKRKQERLQALKPSSALESCGIPRKSNEDVQPVR
jgi:hypothetical protein